jgi:hypothetical protein
MQHTTEQTSFSRRFIIAMIGLAVMIALGAIGISSENAGAHQAGLIDNGAHLLGDAEVKPSDAIDIALSDIAGNVEDVDLEYIGEELIYEIEIDDQPVHVDAVDGTLVYVEFDNDEDVVSRPRTESDEIGR